MLQNLSAAQESYDECRDELLKEYEKLKIKTEIFPEIIFDNEIQFNGVEGVRYLPESTQIVISSSRTENYSVNDACEDPVRSGLSIVFIHEVFHFIMDQNFQSYKDWIQIDQAYLNSSEEKVQFKNPYASFIEGFAIAGEVFYSENILKLKKNNFNKKFPFVKTHFNRLKEIKTQEKLKEESITLENLRNQPFLSALLYEEFQQRFDSPQGLQSIFYLEKNECDLPSQCLAQFLGLSQQRKLSAPVVKLIDRFQNTRWIFYNEGTHGEVIKVDF